MARDDTSGQARSYVGDGGQDPRALRHGQTVTLPDIQVFDLSEINDAQMCGSSIFHRLRTLAFLQEAMTQPEDWLALWPDPDRVFLSLGIQPGMAVLEMCCDDGHFTAPLAKLVGGNLYVFDIDPEMLDRARAAVAHAGLSVRGWISGEIEELAHALPEAVDVVFMANLLHVVSDKQELAKTAFTALKPGGLFAVIEWGRPPPEDATVQGQPGGPAAEARMSPEDVRAVIEPVGFVFRDSVELSLYHYGMIFHKIVT